MEAGSPRSARLLVAMGPHAAPEVLVLLHPEESARALGLVAQMVPDPEGQYLDPGPDVAAWMATQRALSKQGPREARRVAERVRGPFAAEATLEQVDELWEAPYREPPDGEADPGAPERASDFLLEVLREAPSPGAALALCLAPRPMARRALVELVRAGRTDVCLWMACLDRAFPEALPGPVELGLEILSDLLDGMRSEVREAILGSVRALDPGLGESLVDRRFTIRELEGFDDRQLGELLARAPVEEVSLALREAPEALRRRCLRGLPRGSRSQVQQGLDGTQPVRLRDLERAREVLGALCRDLGLRA